MQATNAHLTDRLACCTSSTNTDRHIFPAEKKMREEGDWTGSNAQSNCVFLRVIPACGELMESDSEANTTRAQ